MCRLVCFELQKIWCKRSFLLSVCALLALNLFCLWYTSIGGERRPELASYKMFQVDIAGMSETEKGDYIKKQKQAIDGVVFVQNILALQNSEMGYLFVEQELEEHPGVFEEYYDLYESGEYLRYTDSLELESLFLNELYGEQIKVEGYGSWLQAVQESKNALGGISIFGEQDKNSFSFRNIQKSAADYESLTAEGIRWTASRAIVSTVESPWTDILLLLSAFLFVGSLITEEKQKGLFCITRSTRYGISPSLSAKLSALLLHCLVFSAVFFGANYLFFGFSAGWCDVTARLQSLAPYMESNLQISIGEYLLFSVLTKGLVLFGACAVLTAACIVSENVVLPYFLGLILWAVSWALYRFVPAASKTSLAKYSNLYGALRTENLYGAYLNLDFGGYPLSRLALSWIVIGIAGVSGVVLSYVFFLNRKSVGRNSNCFSNFCLGDFCFDNFHLRQRPICEEVPSLPNCQNSLKNARTTFLSQIVCIAGSGIMGSLQRKRGAKRFLFRFRPHASLMRHEGYKLLLANRALVILLVSGVLIGYNELARTYTPSVQEQYYQNIMLQLEGEQTGEKIDLIKSESARYQEAFEEIERIDAAVDSGELDGETGRAMKTKWYGITAFYPAFQRVEQQYQLVSERGGSYLYDTGYLYLLGIKGDGVLNDFLLLTIGIVLAFSHVISLEYQSGAWGILCATAKGRRGVITRKIAVCALSAAVFSALPFLCRFISVSAVFPVHGLFFAAGSLPFCQGWPVTDSPTAVAASASIPFCQSWPAGIPVIALVLWKLVLQMICGIILTIVMLVFSGWRKNHVQAIFFGFLFLCVPVILTVLGFQFARWFSLYPLYSAGGI